MLEAFKKALEDYSATDMDKIFTAEEKEDWFINGRFFTHVEYTKFTDDILNHLLREFYLSLLLHTQIIHPQHILIHSLILSFEIEKIFSPFWNYAIFLMYILSPSIKRVFPE